MEKIIVDRGKRKTITGTVVKDKMNKSRVVSVARRVKHPLYKKYVTLTSKFMAHDENNESHEGDIVSIMETRPLSRRKRWRIIQIVEKAK